MRIVISGRHAQSFDKPLLRFRITDRLLHSRKHLRERVSRRKRLLFRTAKEGRPEVLRHGALLCHHSGESESGDVLACQFDRVTIGVAFLCASEHERVAVQKRRVPLEKRFEEKRRVAALVMYGRENLHPRSPDAINPTRKAAVLARYVAELVGQHGAKFRWPKRTQ